MSPLNCDWLYEPRRDPSEEEIFAEWLKSDFHPDVAGCTLDEFRDAYLSVFRRGNR
jgi:hypothetical protein